MGIYREAVLHPPDDLPDTLLAATLTAGWDVRPASMAYRPVGFGSHHWEVTEPTGARWFVTADDLADRRRRADEPVSAGFDRLRASLATARALRDNGRAFVVAPVPTGDGEPLARAGERYAVALYPFVTGESFDWGEFPTPEHRRATLELIIGVHTAPEPVRRLAPVDDFAIPHRDDLDAGLAQTRQTAGPRADRGPYARRAADLLSTHAAAVRRLLDRYDRLADLGRAAPSRAVLTHGEPHPGNTMRSAAGWLLIDWDTALVAPPERDLWSLDPGDGSLLRWYADATGVVALPSMLELYRIRWQLADIAVEVGHFRRPHGDGPNDDASWEVLRGVLTHIGA